MDFFRHRLPRETKKVDLELLIKKVNLDWRAPPWAGCTFIYCDLQTARSSLILEFLATFFLDGDRHHGMLATVKKKRLRGTRD